jgi:hypothetical protein
MRAPSKTKPRCPEVGNERLSRARSRSFSYN